jgi:mRNA interferase RelE/StbE
MASRNQSQYKIRVSEEIRDFLRNLHPQLKRKIKAALKIILSDPAAGKSLRDELTGLKSFRAGSFRIIYRQPSKRVIEIIAVGPRKIIYKETYRLIKKIV